MARLESGESDGVVVFNLARFARRPADGERLITAAERGLAVLDSGAEYDLTSASGRKTFRDGLSAAAFYSDDISEASRRGKQLKASKGKVDKRRSFGFEGDGVTLRQSEADVQREMARRLLAGEPQCLLMDELNERGVLSANCKPWKYTTFRDMMIRPRAAGLIAHNGAVVARLPGDPILDHDTYGRIVALYASRRAGRQPSGRYLLTGIAVCGLCGATLSGRPMEDGRKIYWCRPRREISCDTVRLDEWVADWTIRTLADPKHAVAIDRAETEMAQRRAGLLVKIADRERVAAVIGERLGRDEITLEHHDSVVTPIYAQLTRLRAELDGVATSEPALPAGVRTIPVRDQHYLELLERWDSGTPGERRAMVLQALHGRKLIIGKGKIARFSGDRVTIA
jgi:hypothetical protein